MSIDLSLIKRVTQTRRSRIASVAEQGSSPAQTAMLIDEVALRPLVIAASLLQTPPPIMIAMVGSTAGDGVSTVSMNFARQTARLTRRNVVLIDANLNEPADQDSFERPDVPGLAEFLCGEIPMDQALQRLSNEGLSILGRGRPSVEALSQLMRIGGLNQVRGALRELNQDIVIIDCPSILQFPGTAIIATQADATYLVLRAESTRYEVAEKAKTCLQAAGVAITGAILNGTKRYIPERLYRAL